MITIDLYIAPAVREPPGERLDRLVLEVSSRRDHDRPRQIALLVIGRDRRDVEALMFDDDLPNADAIVETATRLGLPTLASDHAAVRDAGALLAYSSTWPELWARRAEYVDRILRGAKPADLPVQQPTKFELAINLKTAARLGVAVPQSLLLRADEVVR